MSNNNGNWDEQPTQAAHQGQNQGPAQTWQNQQNGGQQGQPNQYGQGQQGYNSQQPQGGPGQYPPVPGQAPQQQYPSQGGYPSGQPNQQGQFGQQNQPGQGYGSQPQGNYPSGGYASQGAPHSSGAPGNNQQWNSQPAAGHGFAAQNNQQQYGQFGQNGSFATTDTKAKPKAGIGRTMGWGVVAAALLAIIGCFGTWVFVKVGSSFGDFNASTNGLGMESSNAPEGRSTGAADQEKVTDGWLILIPALIALALGVLRAIGRVRKPVMWGAVAMGLVAAGVAIYDWFDVRSDLKDLKAQMSSLGDQASFSAGSGWGLTLCLIAGIALVITSALSALRD